MTLHYPDVSKWRKGLDLTGAPAVCAKVTEGTSIADEEYTSFKAQASRLGVFFFSFHFLRRGDPGGQARWCYDHNGAVPLMLDVERRYDPASGIDSRPQLADATGFIDAYRKAGGVVQLCYLPHWYWQDYMGAPPLKPLAGRGMGLVSSQYTAYSDTGPGWDPYGGMAPVIWQYTDSKSFGGQATVDFNAFKGTLAELKNLVNGPQAQPPAAGDDEWVLTLPGRP